MVLLAPSLCSLVFSAPLEENRKLSVLDDLIKFTDTKLQQDSYHDRKIENLEQLIRELVTPKPGHEELRPSPAPAQTTKSQLPLFNWSPTTC